MIDTRAETLIPLRLVAKRFPSRNSDGTDGRTMNTCVPFRWKGLETIMVGGQRFTSEEALARYFDRETERREARRLGGTGSVPADGRTVRQRSHASDRAAAKLAELGA